jgi:hypothetical protein
MVSSFEVLPLWSATVESEGSEELPELEVAFLGVAI